MLFITVVAGDIVNRSKIDFCSTIQCSKLKPLCLWNSTFKCVDRLEIRVDRIVNISPSFRGKIREIRTVKIWRLDGFDGWKAFNTSPIFEWSKSRSGSLFMVVTDLKGKTLRKLYKYHGIDNSFLRQLSTPAPPTISTWYYSKFMVTSMTPTSRKNLTSMTSTSRKNLTSMAPTSRKNLTSTTSTWYYLGSTTPTLYPTSSYQTSTMQHTTSDNNGDGTTIGLATGVVIFIICIIGLLFWCRHKRQERVIDFELLEIESAL